jgi:predicted PurR-regulated permease PerM
MAGQSQVRFATMATILSSIALAGLLVVLLFVLRDVLVWLLLALFAAMILNPVVERLSGLMPRGAAIGLVMVSTVAVAAGFAVLLVPPFIEQVSDLVSSTPALAERVRQNPHFRRLDDRFALGAALNRFLFDLPGLAAGATTPVLQLLGGLMRFSFAAISVGFVTLFMLVSGPSLLASTARLLGPLARARATRLWRGVYRATARYALGTGLLALVAGALATLTLAALGVPYFLPLGASLVFLDLIPFVGAIIGGVLLTAVTALTVGWLRALVVLGVFVVYQQLEGHLLLPVVHHQTVRLSALGVAVALLVGYELAGILGVLLAVPLAGALRVFAQELLAVRDEHRQEHAPRPPPARSPGIVPGEHRLRP